VPEALAAILVGDRLAMYVTLKEWAKKVLPKSALFRTSGQIVGHFPENVIAFGHNPTNT